MTVEIIFEFCKKKETSSVCLLGSGLKLIFNWKAQFILLKSSFKFFADKSLSNITEKRDVPLANSLEFEIKKSSGPRIEP